MSNFKVGDRIKVIDELAPVFKIGDIFKIKHIDEAGQIQLENLKGGNPTYHWSPEWFDPKPVNRKPLTYRMCLKILKKQEAINV